MMSTSGFGAARRPKTLANSSSILSAMASMTRSQSARSARSVVPCRRPRFSATRPRSDFPFALKAVPGFMNARYPFVEQLLVHFAHDCLITSLRACLGDATAHESTTDNTNSANCHQHILLLCESAHLHAVTFPTGKAQVARHFISLAHPMQYTDVTITP